MSVENQALAQYLIKELTERKSVEHKTWIDPQTAEGQAKIVKALIALRNNADVGALLIGVDDKTRKLSAPPPTIDARIAFKEDVIQTLISKYAIPVFEAFVEFVEVAPNTYPIIIVPAGAIVTEFREPAHRTVPAVSLFELPFSNQRRRRFPGWVYFSLPLEIRGFSRHTDFCGLAICGPGAFENFYAN